MYPIYTLRETRTRLYLTWSSPHGHRILKLDRSGEPPSVDPTLYSTSELEELLGMIAEGSKMQGGLNVMLDQFFGVAGLVRFLEAPYLVCITGRTPVAVLGGNMVYTVSDVKLVPLFPKGAVPRHPDEQRYLQIFNGVDMRRNFYFSSYDLSNTLQAHLEGKKGDDKFVWNAAMLASLGAPEEWGVRLIHGFLEQKKISVFGHPIYLTIIARRSRFYAGTRFLKRGANDQGHVANEVETEQIVHSGLLTAFPPPGRPGYTSFVQHRGSIPLFWSQDASNLTPKPPIGIDRRDPFYEAAAKHFNWMMDRYGGPVVVLNLVKMREAVPRESLVGNELANAISYLNQFLPDELRIEHVPWDMARALKSEGDVIAVLEGIAEKEVEKTGFFRSGPEPFVDLSSDATVRDEGALQQGVTRTNCIDCLDRTNAAQFVIAKCALGHQLYALGVLSTPHLSFDTDIVRALNTIYQDHGDTIALQYGGSQLVNTMETYRKASRWRDQSRDMIESLRRFYSNSFTDAEKQHSINLFLGNFTPSKDGPRLWELPTDWHLHNLDPLEQPEPTSYTHWQHTESNSSKKPHDPSEEFAKVFEEYYDPTKLTSLDQVFGFGVGASGDRDGNGAESSPFATPRGASPLKTRSDPGSGSPIKSDNTARDVLDQDSTQESSADSVPFLPEANPAEVQEYKRYVGQFKLSSSGSLSEANPMSHPDFLAFQKHSAHSLPLKVQSQDEELYKHSVKIFARGLDLPTSTKQAQARYSKWLGK